MDRALDSQSTTKEYKGEQARNREIETDDGVQAKVKENSNFKDLEFYDDTDTKTNDIRFTNKYNYPHGIKTYGEAAQIVHDVWGKISPDDNASWVWIKERADDRKLATKVFTSTEIHQSDASSMRLLLHKHLAAISKAFDRIQDVVKLGRL